MPKSKYREISSLSGEELNFKNSYKLPSRLLTKIKKIIPNMPPGLITDLENAITTYKFEEAVFRRAPSYTDIRIQLDEISLQAEMLSENLSKLFPGARSFLLQSHISNNLDYRYLSGLTKSLQSLGSASEKTVANLRDKKGRPTNAFSFLLIAQIARSCIKNTNINPSQTNDSFLELVKIAGEAVGVKDLVDLVDESLSQVNK
ncbi:MAG TPA: hypothetical protein EYN62_02025 [Gammaproteobacteria bacterium]|jgi:hypothetical protein|nr:hypothetical protein [Gammaproteobacteria bacterium]